MSQETLAVGVLPGRRQEVRGGKPKNLVTGNTNEHLGSFQKRPREDLSGSGSAIKAVGPKPS